MAARFPGQGEERKEGRPNDPFAELALIIGFDPREKIRHPVGAASAAGAPTLEEEDQHEDTPGSVGAEPGLINQLTGSDEQSDSGREPASAGEALSASKDDLLWSQDYGQAAVEPNEAAAENPFDDESWQQAVAASLDRITGEISGHGGPAANRHETSAGHEEPEEVPFMEARGAPLEPAGAGDEPRPIEDVEWDLSDLDDPVIEEPLRPTELRGAIHDVPLQNAQKAVEELDFDPLADFDLDNVLAESIELELATAWSEQPAPAIDPVERHTDPAIVSGKVAVEEMDDLDFEDLDFSETDPEPQSLASNVSEDEAPVTAEASRNDPDLDFETELMAMLAEEDEASSPAENTATMIPLEAALAPQEDQDGQAAVSARFDQPAQRLSVAAPAGVTGMTGRVGATDPLPHPSPPGSRPLVTRGQQVAAAPVPPRAGNAASAATAGEDDPFAALAAMAARYRSGGSAVRPPAAPPSILEAAPSGIPETKTEQEQPVEAMKNTRPSRDDMPEIDTVDVLEPAAALADDLDLPEVAVEQPRAARAPFDDLDTEFADLLEEMTQGRRSTRPAPTSQPDWHQKPPRAPMAQDFSARAPGAEPHGYAAPVPQEMFAQQEATDWRLSETEQDEAVAREEFEPGQDKHAPRRSGRRGFWLASLLAGVVLAGGAGAYAVGAGGIAISGAPALVKADAGPVKVKPKDPGGVTVPNQNNNVYQRVAGSGAEAPTQGRLVANLEEPMDLIEPRQPTPNLQLDVEGQSIEAIVKVDERMSAPEPAPPAVEPEPREEAVTVVPRKVRTMAVRADGTIVAQEEPAVEAVALVAPQVAAAQGALRKVGAGAAAPGLLPAPDSTATGAIPNAPPPPAPVQAATVAAPGDWSMQIASQPSEEGARNAYGDLAQRYAGVLGARGVNIVKAEIDGKGTFWRVRIPAESRNDAVTLCESYKVAGGSCFVSK